MEKRVSEGRDASPRRLPEASARGVCPRRLPVRPSARGWSSDPDEQPDAPAVRPYRRYRAYFFFTREAK